MTSPFSLQKVRLVADGDPGALLGVLLLAGPPVVVGQPPSSAMEDVGNACSTLVPSSVDTGKRSTANIPPQSIRLVP